MIEAAQESLADPLVFELTDEEARIAAARARFRGALRRRFSLRHVAPLVAFALLMAFVAILALTGLIPRRLAEGLLIVAAIVFMMSRMAAHWSLRRAQSGGNADLVAEMAGATKITPDASGLSVEMTSGARRFDYRACSEAEMTGALIYLWSNDTPAIIPARVFASESVAEQFVLMLRAGIERNGAERR